MGTQLISGAQQILMVLGDQGAREPRTMKCTKASKKKTLFIAFFLATFPYANILAWYEVFEVIHPDT